MISSLVSMFNKGVEAFNYNPKIEQKSYNPFSYGESGNPFVSPSFKGSENYAKNQPVAGGYFAGYYNGVPNIVGRKLFIEA